jgi:hypothetical protein
MSILKLIASSSYLTVNKNLARSLSLEAAILYADLASTQIYWNERGEDWFFRTRELTEQETTLSRSKQIKAYKLLKGAGLIKDKSKGIPAKKYYNIDGDCQKNLISLLSDNKTASRLKIERLGIQNLNGINKNTVNKNTVNNKLKEKTLKKENSIFENKEITQLKTEKKEKEKIPQKRKKFTLADIDWPPVFDQNKKLKDTFLSFAQMRKELKKPYKTKKGTETKLRALAKDCEKYGVENVIGAIEFSEGSEYLGIFVHDYTTKKQRNEKQRINNEPKTDFYEAYRSAIYNDQPEETNHTIDINWDEPHDTGRLGESPF